jgi:AraC family transcriptional regulator, exoenzyme S synthesis regulatory protein ExsA
MKITVLPKDLKLSSKEGIQLYNYQRSQDIQKTKIHLSQNTISFLRKGTKEVIGDDETVQITNQHFVLMKSGNCLMTENVSQSFNIYHSVLLFFSDEEVLKFLEKHKLNLNKSERKRSFQIFEYDNFIQSFVNSLEQTLGLTKTMQSKILKNKFEEIMLYLVHKNGLDFLNILATKIDDKIIRLTAIVENNKLNRLNLEELAFLSNMSISTFKREFVKLYDKTPMKWFSEQRLNHVALLLKTQNNRPIELYEEAGYENLSNFVQAFKKNFGMTPKQYQMKH